MKLPREQVAELEGQLASAKTLLDASVRTGVIAQARNAALDEAMAVAAPYAAAHPIGMAILEKIESLKGS